MKPALYDAEGNITHWRQGGVYRDVVHQLHRPIRIEPDEEVGLCLDARLVEPAPTQFHAAQSVAYPAAAPLATGAPDEEEPEEMSPRSLLAALEAIDKPQAQVAASALRAVVEDPAALRKALVMERLGGGILASARAVYRRLHVSTQVRHYLDGLKKRPVL